MLLSLTTDVRNKRFKDYHGFLTDWISDLGQNGKLYRIRYLKRTLTDSATQFLKNFSRWWRDLLITIYPRSPPGDLVALIVERGHLLFILYKKTAQRKLKLQAIQALRKVPEGAAWTTRELRNKSSLMTGWLKCPDFKLQSLLSALTSNPKQDSVLPSSRISKLCKYTDSQMPHFRCLSVLHTLHFSRKPAGSSQDTPSSPLLTLCPNPFHWL